MSKPTLATVKAFIRKNRNALLISTETRFDGMVDGCEPCADRSFTPALTPEEGRNHKNTLGIQGAWFVFDSRDSIEAFNDGTFSGYKIYNCCGSFRLAVRKQPKPRARLVNGQWQQVGA